MSLELLGQMLWAMSKAIYGLCQGAVSSSSLASIIFFPVRCSADFSTCSSHFTMADVEFTAREQRMMALAWRCFDGEPKVDFNKLARLNGMTNTGSAYNAWTKIRKKLAGEPIITKETSRKRARKNANEEVESPPKKVKGRKTSLSSETVSSDDEVNVAKIESPEDD